MADWIDYRMETWSKELGRVRARLRVADHEWITRKVEEFVREAYALGRKDEGHARDEEISSLRLRLTEIGKLAAQRGDR